MNWKGSKQHPLTLKVRRLKSGGHPGDAEDDFRVIRASDFDEKIHAVVGDGVVTGYDPTETTEDVARKASLAAASAAQKELARQAAEDARPEKRGPGRPKKE